MATVIFYNFILLSSTFFVWLSEKGRTKLDRWVLLAIAFLLVFVPASIRYGVGSDYFSYLDIYESPWRLDFYIKEPGFYYVNWLLIKIDAHFQWMYAAFAFIFTAVAFKSYPQKNSWILHFLFFSSLWFFSFNGIRQAISISWCLLALFYFFDKRTVSFFLLILVAAAFHESAILFGVVGLISLIPLRKDIKEKIAPIFFVSFIIISFFSVQMIFFYIETLLNFGGFQKYAGFFQNSEHFMVREISSGLGLFIKLPLSIYIILHAKYLVHNNERYWLVILLVFLYSVSLVLNNEIVIFGRMARMFEPAFLVGLFLLLNVGHRVRFVGIRVKLNKLIIMFFMLYSLAYMVKTSMSIKTNYGDPMLNPYQTILSE